MSTKTSLKIRFPVPIVHPYNLRQAVARFESGYLANILELTRWNRVKAARMLEIGQDELALKISFYQLSPADRTPAGENGNKKGED